jgi:hypothetical protein
MEESREKLSPALWRSGRDGLSSESAHSQRTKSGRFELPITQNNLLINLCRKYFMKWIFDLNCLFLSTEWDELFTSYGVGSESWWNHRIGM